MTRRCPGRGSWSAGAGRDLPQETGTPPHLTIQQENIYAERESVTRFGLLFFLKNNKVLYRQFVMHKFDNIFKNLPDILTSKINCCFYFTKLKIIKQYINDPNGLFSVLFYIKIKENF